MIVCRVHSLALQSEATCRKKSVSGKLLSYTVDRGPHIKPYSVILIMVRYVFTISHNAFTLLGSVFASIMPGILVTLLLFIVIAISL
jgi:hypothetical protein